MWLHGPLGFGCLKTSTDRISWEQGAHVAQDFADMYEESIIRDPGAKIACGTNLQIISPKNVACWATESRGVRGSRC